MAKNLMTKAAFARLCGVGGSSVTKAIKTSLKLAYNGTYIDAAHPAALGYAKKRLQARQRPDAPVTGVDILYEEILVWCKKNNRFSCSGVQRQFGIGYSRAKRIVDMMKATGVDNTRPVASSRAQTGKAPPPAAPANDEWGDMGEEMPEDIRPYADLTLKTLIKKYGGAPQFAHWLGAMQKMQAIEEKQLKNAMTRGDLIERALVEKAVIDPFNSVLLRLLQDGSKTIAAGLQAKMGTGAELPELEQFVSDIMGSFIRPVKAKVARGLRDVGQAA